jgi:two-component system, OmpR family, KDP operon response regulator KdpE
MPRGPTILVVDDEAASRNALRKTFAGAGYQVAEAGTGAEALDRMSAQGCEMIVLDPALSDRDGYDLIRTIRRQSLTPIIVVSMSNDERSKVRAFDLGADDYIAKPFASRELLARVRTAFRHRFQAQGETPIFVSGDLMVDLVRREVRVRGRQVALTPLEYQVLSVLVRHVGRVLTHRQLTREIWGESTPASLQPLRVVLSGLRRKIEANPNRPTHIVTETRIGYRLTATEEVTAGPSLHPTGEVGGAGGGREISATAEQKEAASKQQNAQSRSKE